MGKNIVYLIILSIIKAEGESNPPQLPYSLSLALELACLVLHL